MRHTTLHSRTGWACLVVALTVPCLSAPAPEKPALRTEAATSQPANRTAMVAAMHRLQEADARLEDGDTEAAATMLDVLAASDAPPTARHAARMQRGQIRGVFAARQAFWRDRQVADVVVLVPDEAAFLDALGAWTPQRFWPILIEDGWFTPMFIRAFQPAAVWRVPPRERPGGERLDDAVRAFVKGLNAEIAAQFADRPRPPGLVMLDPASGQRMGGLALACGRGQPTTTAVAQVRST